MATVALPKDYRPSMDEPFMSERQREYFRQKLVVWRKELMEETNETLVSLQEEDTYAADLTDRASNETDRAIILRTRDRDRRLIMKIDDALRRLDEGTYGYCEETGEPIGLARLEARPIATLSVEAQERREREEKTRRNPYLQD